MKKSSKEKIITFFLGFIFLIIILEIILKLLGIIYINISNSNLPQTTDKNTTAAYKIICIGESTTFNYFKNLAYPFFLEKSLNKKNLKQRFQVFNLGRPGTNSSVLLEELEDNIKKYNPHMVISMMGANDGQYVVNYGNSKSSILNMFQWLNIFKRKKPLLNKSNDNLIIPFVDIGDTKTSRWHSHDYFPQEIINSAKSNIELYNKYRTIFNSNKDEFYKLLEYFDKASSNSINNNQLLFAYSYNVIGDKLFKMNELDKAKHYYRKAINTYPSHYDFYHSMLHKIYSSKELENLLKNKIEENLYAPWAYANLAKFYYELNINFGKAIDLFEKAIELGTKDPSVYATLAFHYTILGLSSNKIELINKVYKLFSEGYKLAPDHEFIKKQLVVYDQMIATFRGTERLDVLIKKKDLLLTLINSKFEKQDFFFQLGMIYEELKDFNNAETYYLQALKENDVKNINALNIKKRLAGLYLQLNDIDKANYYSNSVKEEEYHSEITKKNYLKLKKILDKNKIKLVAMQYPTRNINILKSYFSEKEKKDMVFIDNKNLFYEPIKEGKYFDYFEDSCYGTFGHTTSKGSEMIAEYIAGILKKNITDW